jgi:hypothetical protein
MPQAAESDGAIRAAKEMGASEIPQAALHLKLAQENLDRGKELMADDEHADARRALERAELDAELAMAIVREHQAQEQLDRSQDELAEIESRLQSAPARAPEDSP